MDVLVFVCEHCDEEFPSHLHRIEHKLDVSIKLQEKILNAQEDVANAVAAVKSVTDTLVTIGNDLQAAAANIQNEIAALVAGGQPVDTTALNTAVDQLNATIAPLKAAQDAVDALETPPVETPPAP